MATPASTNSSKIIDLRNLLAERFPQAPIAPASRLTTGIPPLDEPLGGGLTRGAITELSSTNASAGTALLIAALLDAVCRSRYFIALVDGRDSFDPQSLGNRRLQHLLWIRCENAAQALKATDLLLRDGNFPIVIMDLVLNAAEQLRKIPQTSWYRLQRLVEPTPSALLVLTRRSSISRAQWKLSLENSWRLADLENKRAISQLRIRVRRAHAAAGAERMLGVG